MKRGEAWWVDFAPSAGGEIQKKRPAVIVSNDSANRHLNRLQVLPLTSKVDHVYPSEAVVVLRKARNKAMADQLTTVSKQRLLNRIAKFSPADMTKVEQALMVQLGMSDARA